MEDKCIAWISGASGGIGAAIAIEFAKHGIHVAIGYHQAKKRAEEVMALCRQYGVSAVAVQMNMKAKKQIEHTYSYITEKLGHPSIVVHAAGNTHFGLVQDITDEIFDELMAVHVRGGLYLVQASLPYLIQKKSGRIIMISSIWGEIGAAGEVLYSTVKGAQIAMVRSLAQELAPSGITVNAVTPGAINTAMLSQQLSSFEKNDLCDQIPLGRLGHPDEVASLVRFLCEEKAMYITGQTMAVNGGWHTG
ncbi:SDR family oxidoreductase [Hazenella sp. IB182357]|uniref:SDR family oxidoreductase n=1 Tax=Polycladospora coralii TaxID=2771432 RepID=A0A926RVC1_9BACL|nr:SDR family oxidoreductase [Polycladospora coralii]MBD1373652.1 SDR family oxidoreductase [Polycladospora coralii]